MGHQVTIEGSRTMPGDRLAPGVRTTVEVTDYVRALVRNGSVNVVAGSLDAPAVADGSELDDELHDPDTVPESDTEDDDDDEDVADLEPEPTADPPAVTPPGRNASRAEWAEFLDNHEPEPIDYPNGAGRDALRDVWDDSVKAQEPRGDS